MNQKTLRALWCLRETTSHSTINSRRFAELMWPKDDPRYAANWKRVSKIGHGSTRGVGMWRSGGSYLAWLARNGFVMNMSARAVDLPTYCITNKGLRVLEQTPFDPNRPACLTSAVASGQRVRLRRDIRSVGGDVFPEGATMRLVSHWRGKLNLVGSCKGKETGLRRVSETAVEFLPPASPTKPSRSLRARKTER